jgi:hypothetical protein
MTGDHGIFESSAVGVVPTKMRIRPMGDVETALLHQAAGIVSVQLGVSANKALIELCDHAIATDRPLIELAQDVVDQRLRFD